MCAKHAALHVCDIADEEVPRQRTRKQKRTNFLRTEWPERGE